MLTKPEVKRSAANNPCVYGIRIAFACGKVRKYDHVNATRIWNVIDNLDNPEQYWQIMTFCLPWAFDDDRDVNSIIFRYH